MNLINFISNLFAINSLQFWWYLTRAAGLMGYFLIWLSTFWGLVVSSKILDSFLDRGFTFDFHEYLSLIGLGFVAVHVLVLMADKYLPYNLGQILIPFLSPYRPLWVGIGVIALYLTLLVTITFYLRKKIGMDLFRKLHYLSLVAYVGTTLHGLYAGTDSALAITNILYKGTALLTLFVLAYWLIMLWYRKQEEEALKKERLWAELRNRKQARTTTTVTNTKKFAR